ncbi:hypothetical protein V6O07_03840, partial [Arthrospira platensis SPKY2]
MGTGWRIKKDGDEFVFYHCHTVVGRWLPNNVFVFAVNGQTDFRQALSTTLERKIGLRWEYKDRFRYTVCGAEVYAGLMIDMNTRKPMNALPPLTTNSDRKLDKDLKERINKWCTVVKTMVRLGAFADLPPLDWSSRLGMRSRSGKYALYKSIRDGDTRLATVYQFIDGITYGYQRDPAEVCVALDKAIKHIYRELAIWHGIYPGAEAY